MAIDLVNPCPRPAAPGLGFQIVQLKKEEQLSRAHFSFGHAF